MDAKVRHDENSSSAVKSHRLSKFIAVIAVLELAVAMTSIYLQLKG
jgi:hypothetical protein